MKVNRTEFIKALKAVQPGVSKKDLIEQSDNLIFKDGFVMSFNDEVAVYHPMELGITGAVKADELMKILGRIKSEEINVEIKDSEFVISTKSSMSGISFSPEIKVPFDEFAPPEKMMKVNDGFMTGLTACASVACHDYTEPLLRYICIKGGVMYASDSYRAIRHSSGIKSKELFYVQSSIVSGLESFRPVAMAKKDSWLYFKNSEGALFCTRTIEEESFPVTDEMFTKTGKVVPLPEEISEAVESAEVFTSQRKEEASVSVRIKDGTMILKGEGEYGWFKQKFKIESKEQMSFEVSPEVLREAVRMGNSLMLCQDSVIIATESFIYVAGLMGE